MSGYGAMRRIILCSLAFVPAAPGAPIITRIETTQSQAIIRVSSIQAASCTIAVSRGPAITSNLIPDIVDNGNAVSRAGTVGPFGNSVVFVVGAHEANEALAADAQYTAQVSCGADGTSAARTFQTKPIQWGNTAPDIVPFNPARFGNMDHPAIDWNGTAASNTFADPSTRSYTDPNTGTEYWKITQSGWAHIAGMNLANINSGVMGVPLDVTGSKWANPANVTSNGASFSVASGGPTDNILIPLNQFGCPAGSGSMAGFDGGNCTIDDVMFDIYCGNAAASGITLTLQLAIWGQPAGNSITTSACPTTAPVKIGSYPNVGGSLVPQPIFKGWGYVPARNHVMPPAGTVLVSGTSVTLTSAGNNSTWFDNEWPVNTPILIGGNYYKIAASPAPSSTTLTLQSGPSNGSYNYTGVELGLLINKSNNGSNVSVSVGINYAYSETPDACCNGDIPTLNMAPVSVSRSADGVSCGIYTVGCTGGVLNPPVAGYLGFTKSASQNTAIFLWIPKNSDGSPRGESRLLSSLTKPAGSARLHGNGDSFTYSVSLGGTAVYDNVEGPSLYVMGTGGGFWKLKYNESYGASCIGYGTFAPYTYAGGRSSFYPRSDGTLPVNDDCFDWYKLTPTAGGKDMITQIRGSDGHSGAYQTGLNYQGTIVGPAHPGFDLGWLTWLRNPIAVDGGLVSLSLDNGQNRMGILATFGDDGTGTNTWVLKGIRNMWNDGAIRWGGNHACPVTEAGTYRFCVIDPLDDTGQTNLVFPNRNKANVTRVNRAGYGSSPVWDCSGCPGGPNQNTSVGDTEVYTCPGNLPSPFAAYSGTAHCLQIKLNTPLCQQNPNTSYTFPDGKYEAAEFPCTTPGFGVANASYSKLQDMVAGDWLLGEQGVGHDLFYVLSISYNSATDIDLWTIRRAADVVPALYNTANGGGNGCTWPGNCTHADPWFVWGVDAFAGNSGAIDVSNPDATWVQDNPYRFSGHGVMGGGTLPGTYSYAQGGWGGPGGGYFGHVNLTPAQMVNQPWVALNTSSPSFAGISNGAFQGATLASYANGSYNPSASRLPFFVDWPYIQSSTFGNSFTTALVAGTTYTYRISADCCIANPDYKRWGLQAFAGRFWLKDVSSPVTLQSMADMPAWSVCKARNANECVFGAASGQIFVAAPRRDSAATCLGEQFGQAVPCVSAFGPIVDQVIQFRSDKPEATGRYYRKFGFMHGHAGLPYFFSNCRTSPEAEFLFCPGYWMDGVRTEWLAVRIGALPPIDTVDRTTFVPVQVSATGVASAGNIRARFGYAENGGDLLRCTAYAQDCSTEIPSGSPTDPFSFTNEPVARQACPNGAQCTVSIPSLPNRVLYYVIDRLDSNGNVLSTGPLQVAAVP